MKTEEGTHSLFVEGLDVKLDKDDSFTFTPEKAGDYKIVCSVFCGPGHGDMTANLVVVK